MQSIRLRAIVYDTQNSPFEGRMQGKVLWGEAAWRVKRACRILSRAVGMPPPGWEMLLAMGAMGYFWDFLRRRARQAPRARRVTELVTT